MNVEAQEINDRNGVKVLIAALGVLAKMDSV